MLLQGIENYWTSDMNEAEFDKFAEEYYGLHAAGIACSGEGPEYFSEYKIADIFREYKLGKRQISEPLQILDFGSGIGGSIPYVHKQFSNAKLICLDPSLRSLEVAEKQFGSLAQYVHFDGKRIPFPADKFDIAYAMCVFHHIDHDAHISLLKELRRVIRPCGNLFIFEHNPYNPLTVRVVNNCPFDENAKLIRGRDMRRRLLAAGFDRVTINYRVFFPHLFRVLRPLERFLTWLPIGGQYYARSQK
jgi:SAM-dependent methyltransferase